MSSPKYPARRPMKFCMNTLRASSTSREDISFPKSAPILNTFSLMSRLRKTGRIKSSPSVTLASKRISRGRSRPSRRWCTVNSRFLPPTSLLPSRRMPPSRTPKARTAAISFLSPLSLCLSTLNVRSTSAPSGASALRISVSNPP